MKKHAIIGFLFYFAFSNFSYAQTCNSTTIDSIVELSSTVKARSIDVNALGNVLVYSGTYAPNNMAGTISTGTNGFPPVFSTGSVGSAGYATLADPFSLVHPFSNVFSLMPTSIASTIDVKAIRFTNNGDVLVAGEAFSLAPLTLNFIIPFPPFIVNTVNKIMFISYYGITGTNVWNKTLISSGNAGVEDIVTDALGNIYITGKFYGTVDFDPGVGVVNQTTALFLPGGYVLKLDSLGNYVNVYTFSGGVDIRQITINSAGTQISLVGTAGFNPFAAPPNPVVPTTITIPGWNAGLPINLFGAPDGYLLVLDSTLAVVNKFALYGGTMDDDILTVQYDLNGDIVLGGFTASTMNMDINGGTSNVSGNHAMVLAKYNGSSFSLSWVNTYGSSGNNAVRQVIIDPNNNVVAGVDFTGNVPPLGTTILPGVINIGTMEFTPSGILRNATPFFYGQSISFTHLTNRWLNGSVGVITRIPFANFLVSFTDNCL